MRVPAKDLKWTAHLADTIPWKAFLAARQELKGTLLTSIDNLLVLKLRHGARLSKEDESVLNGLAGVPQQLPARQDIVAEDTQPHALVQIVSGWACKYRDLPDGRRQIITIFLPGDLCEPFGALPRSMSHSIGTLTSVSYAHIPAHAARAAARTYPAIEQALWWDALVADSLLQERTVSLGQRSAFERLAHCFCELHARLQLVGLATDAGFHLPLTQLDLGHALGLSVVHLNRSLQTLRQTGCISWARNQLTIHDLNDLRDIASFDTAFLHGGGISFQR